VVAVKAQTHCPRLERVVPWISKNGRCLDTNNYSPAVSRLWNDCCASSWATKIGKIGRMVLSCRRKKREFRWQFPTGSRSTVPWRRHDRRRLLQRPVRRRAPASEYRPRPQLRGPPPSRFSIGRRRRRRIVRSH